MGHEDIARLTFFPSLCFTAITPEFCCSTALSKLKRPDSNATPCTSSLCSMDRSFPFLVLLQGAAWCKVEKHNRIHDEAPTAVTTTVRPTDVEGLSELASVNWTGDSAVYKHQGGGFVSVVLLFL
jgi:hypothetical protein